MSGEIATAINDSGKIVGNSNYGSILLTPLDRCTIHGAKRRGEKTLPCRRTAADRFETLLSPEGLQTQDGTQEPGNNNSPRRAPTEG
jgi:hypothetical protein